MDGAADPCCAILSLLPGTVTDAFFKKGNFAPENEFELGNAVDHGLYRFVSPEDRLRSQLLKGKDLLHLLPLGVKDMGESRLL